MTQGVQTRSFVYNWAGQLLSATNPESGTTSYQYDAEGNLIAKLDARGAGSCAGNWNVNDCDGSGVDNLGRIVRKTYKAGTSGVTTQEVVYCFDGKKPVKLTGPDRVECNSAVTALSKGLLTGVGNLASRTEYTHDEAGRVTRSLQITEGSTAGSRAVEYQYWASDRVKKTKYPSGREVVECLDGRLRVVWANGVKLEGDCTAGTAVASTDAYVTNAEYAAHGALAKWQLGNGLWEVAQFNDRLQMERKRIGLTNAAQNCGVAADDELCLEWGDGSTSSNNGNVMEAKQWRMEWDDLPWFRCR